MGRKLMLVVFVLSLLFATYSFSNAAEAEIKLKFASLFIAYHKNAQVLQAFQKRSVLDLAGFRISFQSQRRTSAYVTQSMLGANGPILG